MRKRRTGNEPGPGVTEGWHKAIALRFQSWPPPGRVAESLGSFAAMAYILCPKHGGTGAAAVCSHVAARVEAASAGQSRETLSPVRVTVGDTTLGPTWLCADCARQHSVPPEGLHLHGDDGLDRYMDIIGFTPICPRCFEESYGRAASQKLETRRPEDER